MHAPVHDPVLTNHFTFLIYPFIRRPGQVDSSKGFLEQLEARWLPWWTRPRSLESCRSTHEEIDSKLDESDFFLPHVRGLLFPETTLLDSQEFSSRCSAFLDLCAGGIAHLAGQDGMPSDGVRHLTTRPDVWGVPGPLLLDFHELGGYWPFRQLHARIDWVDLHLFSAGSGFLVFKVRLDQDKPTLAKLMALNIALRGITPRWPIARLPKLSLNGKVTDRSFPELIDEILEDVCPGAGRYTQSREGRGHGSRCQILSYACAPGASDPGLDPGVFEDRADRILYEFATGWRLGDSIAEPNLMPTAEQARTLIGSHRFNDWRCWRAMALKDGCFFLGTEPASFARGTLASNVETSYLPMYLLTLHQHLQLLRFTEQLLVVARADLHHTEAHTLYRAFIAFRNRYWVSMVTSRPQGNRLYELMQRGLDLAQTFEMVSSGVKAAKEYYGELFDRDVARAKAVLGVMTGVAMPSGGVTMWLWGKGVWGWAGIPLLWAAILCLPPIFAWRSLAENSPLRAIGRSYWKGLVGTLSRWFRPGGAKPPSPQNNPVLLPMTTAKRGLSQRRAA